MNTTIDLEPADPKYLDLVEGEIVTLIEEVDDKNFTRLYRVVASNEETVNVEVVSEEPKKDFKGQNALDATSLVGEIFKRINRRYFSPYL